MRKIGIYFTKIILLYFSNRGEKHCVSKSGHFLTIFHAVIMFIFHGLCADILKFEWAYDTWAWFGYYFLGYLLAPLVMLYNTEKWYENKPKRFLKGAYFPLNYWIIFALAFLGVGSENKELSNLEIVYE